MLAFLASPRGAGASRSTRWWSCARRHRGTASRSGRASSSAGKSSTSVSHCRGFAHSLSRTHWKSRQPRLSSCASVSRAVGGLAITDRGRGRLAAVRFPLRLWPAKNLGAPWPNRLTALPGCPCAALLHITLPCAVQIVEVAGKPQPLAYKPVPKGASYEEFLCRASGAQTHLCFLLLACCATRTDVSECPVGAPTDARPTFCSGSLLNNVAVENVAEMPSHHFLKLQHKQTRTCCTSVVADWRAGKRWRLREDNGDGRTIFVPTDVRADAALYDLACLCCLALRSHARPIASPRSDHHMRCGPTWDATLSQMTKHTKIQIDYSRTP